MDIRERTQKKCANTICSHPTTISCRISSTFFFEHFFVALQISWHLFGLYWRLEYIAYRNVPKHVDWAWACYILAYLPATFTDLYTAKTCENYNTKKKGFDDPEKHDGRLLCAGKWCNNHNNNKMLIKFRCAQANCKIKKRRRRFATKNFVCDKTFCVRFFISFLVLLLFEDIVCHAICQCAWVCAPCTVSVIASTITKAHVNMNRTTTTTKNCQILCFFIDSGRSSSRKILRANAWTSLSCSLDYSICSSPSIAPNKYIKCNCVVLISMFCDAHFRDRHLVLDRWAWR